jgi:hypothetical protein
MSSRVLATENRGSRRRAHAHGVKIIETNALGRQPFQVGRAVEIVQRVTLGLAGCIQHEGDRSVHHSQVVNQKYDDVGWFRMFGLIESWRRSDRQTAEQNTLKEKHSSPTETCWKRHFGSFF